MSAREDGDDRDEARVAAVLARRAERLAKIDAAIAPRRVALEIALVGVSVERFGVPAAALRAITTMPAITRLPGLPPWMLGVAQHAGDLVSIVDLGAWLGIEKAGAPGYVAFVDTPSGGLGLAVESVLGFRPVHDDELAPAATRAAIAAAITRDLVTILDVKRLGESPELVVRSFP